MTASPPPLSSLTAESVAFDPAARWVWTGEWASRWGSYRCFRRAFTVEGPIRSSSLKITADSRYALYLNGRWIGRGPIRAWPAEWPVDTYDLSAWLVPGRNVLAIRVHHFGLSTFQYLWSPPGLLAQLDWEDAHGAQRLCTDTSWRAADDPASVSPAPRINPQQGWEEQFDARLELCDSAGKSWTAASFDDTGWPAATALHRAGEGAHPRLVPRPIPLLTRQIIYPARILSADSVKPAPYNWSLNLHDFFNPDDRTSNICIGAMLLATHIHSPRAQRISLHMPGGVWWIPTWKLNGQTLRFDDRTVLPTETGVAHGELRAGWNTLLCQVPQVAHLLQVSLSAWTEHPVRFAARPDSGKPAAAWIFFGPFDHPELLQSAGAEAEGSQGHLVRAKAFPPGATGTAYTAMWERGYPTTGELDAPFARPIDPATQPQTDVYAQCLTERIVPDAPLRIEESAAMLQDNAAWTVIHPPAAGLSVRVLLDFDRQVVGSHTFEIDAPAGTIVDGHCFEFIQRDGRINLSEGVANAFRYVCRDGVQQYTCSLRRGFRYTWLSFRNFDRPIRVRSVGLILDTYPAVGTGRFDCSDPLLAQVWQVGAHSVRCSMADTYEDCCYEQAHWVGDAQVEAMIDLVVNGDPRLSAHSWRQAAQSLQRSPLVEALVPSGWQLILSTWSLLWMRWAQEHYQFTADADFARDALPPLQQNIQTLKDSLTSDGLIQYPAWNLFDWAPMDTPANGIVTHVNCLAVLALRQSAMLARAVGHRALAREWSRLADTIAAAVNTHLWDEHRSAYIDCIRADGKRSDVFSQQTQTAALLGGVPRGRRRQRVWKILRDPPEGFVRAGSPFFMGFLLAAMVRRRQFEPMLDVIRSYWGAQVEAGATTFWEMYHPDQPRYTRSHCHGWSGMPAVFLSQQVLGIQPASPGYRRARIAPRIGDLRWAQGSVPTPRGPIDIYWKREANRFRLDVTLPHDTQGEVHLPVEGEWRAELGEAESLGRSAEGRTCVRVGPGRTILQIDNVTSQPARAQAKGV